MKTSESIKESDSYNFLLLSLYYYFKKNNKNKYNFYKSFKQ